MCVRMPGSSPRSIVGVPSSRALLGFAIAFFLPSYSRSSCVATKPKKKKVLLWVVGGGGVHDNWDLGSQKLRLILNKHS